MLCADNVLWPGLERALCCLDLWLHGSHVEKTQRDNSPGAQATLLFSPKWDDLEQRFAALGGFSKVAEVRGLCVNCQLPPSHQPAAPAAGRGAGGRGGCQASADAGPGVPGLAWMAHITTPTVTHDGPAVPVQDVVRVVMVGAGSPRQPLAGATAAVLRRQIRRRVERVAGARTRPGPGQGVQEIMAGSPRWVHVYLMVRLCPPQGQVYDRLPGPQMGQG